MIRKLQSQETGLIQQKNLYAGRRWIVLGLAQGALFGVLLPLVNWGLWGETPNLRPLNVGVQLLVCIGLGLWFGWVNKLAVDRALAKRMTNKK